MKIAYPLALGCVLMASPALADGPFGPDTGFRSFGGSAPAFELRAFAVAESQHNDFGSYNFGIAAADLRYVYRGDSLSFGLGAAVYAYQDDFTDPQFEPQPYAFVQFGGHRLTYGTASQSRMLVRRQRIGETGYADLDPLMSDDVLRYDFLGENLLFSTSLRNEVNVEVAASYTQEKWRVYATAEFETDVPDEYYLELGGEYALNDRIDLGLHGFYSSYQDGGGLLAGIDWHANQALTLSAIAGTGYDGAFTRLGVGAAYDISDRVGIYAEYDSIESFGTDAQGSKIGLKVNF